MWWSPSGSSAGIETGRKLNRSGNGLSVFEDQFSILGRRDFHSPTAEFSSTIWPRSVMPPQHNSDRTGSVEGREWRPIWSAPFDRNLELAVIDEEGEHTLVSPCRRAFGAWIDIKTNQRLVLDPTHWREWGRHTR